MQYVLQHWRTFFTAFKLIDIEKKIPKTSELSIIIIIIIIIRVIAKKKVDRNIHSDTKKKKNMLQRHMNGIRHWPVRHTDNEK